MKCKAGSMLKHFPFTQKMFRELKCFLMQHLKYALHLKLTIPWTLNSKSPNKMIPEGENR